MSVREAAILMGAGALLELPALVNRYASRTKPRSADPSNTEKRFLRSAGTRSLTYVGIYAFHVSYAWLVKLLARKRGCEWLRSHRWMLAALCSATAQMTLPEPLSAMMCCLMLPRPLARFLIERFPTLAKIPSQVWWLTIAVVMNVQLWTRYHYMPSRWRTIMLDAAGIPQGDKALMHRSETREVVPCDDPTYGIHPGMDCTSAALVSVRRGLPRVLKLYAIIHIITFLVSLRSARTRAAWRQKPLSRFCSILSALVRSALCLLLSCAGGRAAFCVQSRLYPHDFKWWIGGIVGFFAGQPIAFLDGPASRTQEIEFNAGNVIYTECVSLYMKREDWQQVHRLLSAVLFALATGAYVASERGNGLFLLPMVAKVWSSV